MHFKFYDNFLQSIDQLPEEQKHKACYDFCKFGVTGELPIDPVMKMFCLGVKVSVQKYQGRGGNNNPTGRNQYNQVDTGGQSGQSGQSGLNIQTKTKTKTETEKGNTLSSKLEENHLLGIKPEEKVYLVGEFKSIKLTMTQYKALLSHYGTKMSLIEAIDSMESTLSKDPKFYKNHYLALRVRKKYNKGNYFSPEETPQHALRVNLPIELKPQTTKKD